jgi:hypothetical protein
MSKVTSTLSTARMRFWSLRIETLVMPIFLPST